MTPPARRGLRSTLLLAWRVARPQVSIAAASTAIGAAAPVGMALFGQRMIDGLVARDGAAVTRAILGEALVGAVLYVAIRAQAVVRVVLADRVAFELDRIVLRASAALPLVEVERSDVQATIVALRRDVERHGASATARVATVVQLGAGALLATAALLVVSQALTSVLLLLSIALLLAELRIGRRNRARALRAAPVQWRLRYLGDLLSQPEYAKETRLGGIAARWLERHRELGRVCLEVLHGGRIRETWLGSALVLANVLAVYGFYYAVADAALRGALTAGQVVYAVTLFRAASTGAVTTIGAGAMSVEDGLALDALWAFGERAGAGPTVAAPPERTAGDGLALVVEGVGYRYARGEATCDALADVSFAVHRGETLTIVGRNGAGKSTLVRLLAGLDRPAAGAIRIGSVDAHALAATGRPIIAAAFQDFARPRMTVRENLGLLCARPPGDDAMWDALKRGGLAERIRALHAQLDTNLGHEDAAEVELSLGEWQRLILCRIALSDAAVVVLDEPTSFLDAATGPRLVAELILARRDRISIVVTHSEMLARRAARVLALKRGRVVAHGEHGRLLEAGGAYAELWGEPLGEVA